jgi:hypothetical protein
MIFESGRIGKNATVIDRRYIQNVLLVPALSSVKLLLSNLENTFDGQVPDHSYSNSQQESADALGREKVKLPVLIIGRPDPSTPKSKIDESAN